MKINLELSKEDLKKIADRLASDPDLFALAQHWLAPPPKPRRARRRRRPRPSGKTRG